MEVKIVECGILFKGRAERTLTQLVNEGWRIVTAGGGGSFPHHIVILQRDNQVRQRDRTPGSGVVRV